MHPQNLDRENLSPVWLDQHQEGQTPEEIVDALQTLVSDVDGFLSCWFQRLDQCVQESEPRTAGDAALKKRYSEFQNEKVRWERQREVEQQQIREQAEQLTDAWLRLEEEQRRFLQLKSGQRAAGPERESGGRVNLAVDQDRSTTSEVGSAGAASTPAHDVPSQRRLGSTLSSPACDTAIRQFQQLRREIESSRPNVVHAPAVNERTFLRSGDRT